MVNLDFGRFRLISTTSVISGMKDRLTDTSKADGMSTSRRLTFQSKALLRMRWEGKSTIFKRPAIDGETMVKKCFIIYRCTKKEFGSPVTESESLYGLALVSVPSDIWICSPSFSESFLGI